MMQITDATAPFVFKTGNIPPDLEAAIGRYMVKKHTVKKKQVSLATPKNGNRKRIWEIIKKRGPISAREAGEKVGLKSAASGQHIISLEIQGLIEFAGMGKYKANQQVKMWKATEKSYGTRKAVLDKEEKKNRVVAALVNHGRLTRDEITELTGLPKSTLQGYMPALIKAGRIVRSKRRMNARKALQVHYYVEEKK